MTLRGLGLGVLGWLLASCLYGQFTLSGTVTDTRGQILPGAAVLVEENIRLGVTTDRDGQFSIVFPSEGPWTVKASFVGHGSETERITFQRPNMTQRFKLTPGTNLGEAEVVGDGPKDVTVQRIDLRLASKILTPRGTIEDALLQAPVNFTSNWRGHVRGAPLVRIWSMSMTSRPIAPSWCAPASKRACPSPTPTWWTALNSVQGDLRPNTGTNSAPCSTSITASPPVQRPGSASAGRPSNTTTGPVRINMGFATAQLCVVHPRRAW